MQCLKAIGRHPAYGKLDRGVNLLSTETLKMPVGE